MKGFIEVHNWSWGAYLLNVNAIERVYPIADGAHIQIREGEHYKVRENYETVKFLISKAITPVKEKEE
jgi:uncharacterized protein YlzI (FlbEa/FlbD family)